MSRDPSKRDREVETPGVSPTVMAHLFRGELSRSDIWRTRLDTTTNWAITTAAAVISFGFSNPNASHVVLLVGVWLVFTFLIIEARRYRYYDLWNRRVRLLEGGYWAPMIRREPIDPDAMRELAVELTRPQIQLSLFAAVSTRMNRAYGSILLIILIAWFAKLYSHPLPAAGFDLYLERAHIGPVPGGVVFGVVCLLTVLFILAFVTSLVARPPLGELRPRPRSRRLALWETVFRPYAVPQAPRRRAPPSARSAPAAPVPPTTH